MKFFWLLLAMLLSLSTFAQDKPAPAKKPVAKKTAHKKPTPEQIRKFRELEKKQKKR